MTYRTMSGYLLYLAAYLKTYGDMRVDNLNAGIVIMYSLTSKSIETRYSMHRGNIGVYKLLKCCFKCRQVLIHVWISLISISKRQHYITELLITSFK